MSYCRCIYCASGEEGVQGESRSFYVPSWLRYGGVHSRMSRNESEVHKSLEESKSVEEIDFLKH